MFPLLLSAEHQRHAASGASAPHVLEQQPKARPAASAGSCMWLVTSWKPYAVSLAWPHLLLGPFIWTPRRHCYLCCESTLPFLA